MKDWSAAEVDRVFAALTDWREQFTEHKSKVGLRRSPHKERVRISRGLEWTETTLAFSSNTSSFLKALISRSTELLHDAGFCQAETLKENCVSFGMPAPRLEGVDALEEDLADTESSWALYKEYSSELKVIVAYNLEQEGCA